MSGFGHAIDGLAGFLLASGIPAPIATALAVVAVAAGPIMGVVLVVAALGQIIERKVAATMQRRLGPNTAGMDGVIRLVIRLTLFWAPRERQNTIMASILRLPGLAGVLLLLQRPPLRTSPLRTSPSQISNLKSQIPPSRQRREGSPMPFG